MAADCAPLVEVDGGHPPWQLCVYVAGQSPKSLRARANLQRLCEEHLPGNFEIEVIDVAEHPSLARRDQIVAIPTLIRVRPLPTRRIVGDLSNTDRVLIGLQLDGQFP
jgi:circadian clock protein KaiB